MPLPLHIFEPRYRLLTQRCLEGGHFTIERAFGVTLLAEGEEGCDNTVPSQVGCTAQINHVAPLPGGRYNLQTVGGRRFEVLSKRMEDEYWIGTVQWLDDTDADAHLDETAAQVRRALEGYLNAIATGTGASTPDLAQLAMPASPYDFSMWIAALLPLTPREKQPLLEMTSTAQRLEAEYNLLRRAEVIQRAFLRREAMVTDSAARDRFVSLN